VEGNSVKTVKTGKESRGQSVSEGIMKKVKGDDAAAEW